MSNGGRLKAQNDRIRKSIAADSVRPSDGKDFITEDQLWKIWMQSVGDVGSKTELDEFQECVPSPDLARNLYTAIKTISILICIHWHRWHEFAERFCQLTEAATLDDVHDLDGRLPFANDILETLLFPDEPCFANNFFLRQFVFLPLILQELQGPQVYASQYRLPLLDDQDGILEARYDRIVPVLIAKGHHRFAKGGMLNSTPHRLCQKRASDESDLDREIHNLAVLRGPDDQHTRILQHLVALKLGSEYNIFYPDAELDLQTLLDGTYQPFYNDNDLAPLPLIDQAWCLAGALDFIHHRIHVGHTKIPCCHLDLEPANVLILKGTKFQKGKWMLTDFGTAVIKSEAEPSYSAADDYADEDHIQGTATRSTRYPGQYQPPENEQSHPRRRDDNLQKGNIWSFGCILTVLLIFSLGGDPLVKKFHAIKHDDAQTDCFYSTVTSGINPIQKVKPQIKSWTSQLATHQGSWASDWFRLIFDNVLQISPTQRLDAKQIQDQLDLLRRHAPMENVWKNIPQDIDALPTSPPQPLPDSQDRRPSWVSMLSSRRPSSAQVSAQASTPEVAPAAVSSRDLDADPLMIVHDTPQTKHTPLSPIDSVFMDGTISPNSIHSLPIDEMNVQGELPSGDDLTVLADPERLVFWNSQKVVPYTRKSGTFRATSSLSSYDAFEAGKAGFEGKNQANWIHVSLSGPYLALVRSYPSAAQITVMDLDHWQEVQPNTDWPSLQGLRSVCISCQGSLALFYDKMIKFRCTRENAYLRNSSWSTSSENVCAGSFSPDGNKFFAVSWTQLWIGTVEQNRWVLRASGDHHLSARAYLSFRPYLVPFSSRESLFAHNPGEDKLCYLEARTSTKVNLGNRVLRVALSEKEDTLLYVRQMRRYNRPKFLPQSSYFYSLSWRTMSRSSHAGQITLGPESETVDLRIPFEKHKCLTLTSDMENGPQGSSLIAWVATSRGEVRKFRLSI